MKVETDNDLLNIFLSRLRDLEDIRRKEGQRHAHELVTVIVVFATMSGYFGYRALGDFVKKHKQELIELFKIKKYFASRS